MVIIDTDVLIDFLGGEQEVSNVVQRIIQYEDAATTIINQYELFKGAESRAQEEIIEGLLSKLDVYAVDYASVKNAASMFHALKKSGELIPETDMLVAGIAQARGDGILTRDRHFKRLRMIKAEII